MTSSQMPALPLEIQSDIVDAISSHPDLVFRPEYKEARETLRTCLSVSPTFRWSARRHLFEKTRLASKSGLDFHNKLTRLRELIDVPDLGILPCIRHFVLNPDFGILCTPQCDEAGRHHVTSAICMNASQNIKFILDMLCHQDALLDTLEIDVPGHCSLATMTSGFQQSLYSAIRSSYLTSLKLYHIRGVPKDILWETSITRFTVIESTIDYSGSDSDNRVENQDDTHLHLQLPLLEFLETDNLSLIGTLYPVNHRLSDERSLSLNELWLEVRDENVGALTMLDTVCAAFAELFPSVENLDLIFRPQGVLGFLTTMPKFDLKQHSALENLTLNYEEVDPLPASTPETRIGLYMAHICSMLRACPDSLQYLTIVLGHAYKTLEEVLFPDPSPWATLDNLLDHETFSYLEGVDIVLRCHFPRGYSGADMQAFRCEAEKGFESVLPTSNAYGKLTVRVMECSRPCRDCFGIDPHSAE